MPTTPKETKFLQVVLCSFSPRLMTWGGLRRMIGIRAGVNLGYAKDVEDKLVPSASPDVGAYQHQ